MQSTIRGGSQGIATAGSPNGAHSGAPGGAGRPGRRGRPNFAALGRAIRYLGHYRRLALTAYLFLFISSGAQLMVPQLVQNILDAVTQGVTAQRIAALPPAAQPQALAALGWSAEQFARYATGSERALYFSGVLIVAFAIMRAFFSFSQTYTSERVSQSVTFDFRNDLYAKVQRLSFSYHDRTQTGQLMVRA